ncbi:uncharacterized protein [Branchiostoma lanceolatum]|uniref:uncharacterized protein n=1 Tax=Branchiostoma lanceolatum TaxID=7740 RepID=UPI003451BAD1
MASKHFWMVLVCHVIMIVPFLTVKGQTTPDGLPLDLFVSPEEVNTTEGAMATFVCSAEEAGPAENLTLRWTWSGAQLRNSSNRIIQSVQNSTSPDGRTSFKNLTLQILDLTPADEGAYICQASLEDQHKQRIAWLHIKDEGPHIEGNSSLWWISAPAICGPAVIVTVILCFMYKRTKGMPSSTLCSSSDSLQDSRTSPKTAISTNRYLRQDTTDVYDTDCKTDQQESSLEIMMKNIPNGFPNPNFVSVLPESCSDFKESRLHNPNKLKTERPKHFRNFQGFHGSKGDFRRPDSGYISSEDFVLEEHERLHSKVHARQERFKHLQTDACEKLIKMPPSKRLITNIVSKTFASGFFDENGGHLSIPDANVHMFIPPNAIKAGRQQEVYIYLEMSPQCNGLEMLGPVLHCGPPGLHFDVQVIFSLPLSTNKSINEWKIIPMRTETDIEKPTNWKPISETEDALCFVEGTTCTFFVDHFTFYGVSCTDDQVFLIGAFSSPSEHTTGQFNFHLRYWKSGLGLTKLIYSEEESKHSHHLETKALHIYPNGADLQLEIEDLSPGWTQLTPTCSRVVVPYARLRSENLQEVQTEFGFKIDSWDRAQGFACRIIAYQLTHEQERAELPVSIPDGYEVLQEQRRDEKLLPLRVFNSICVSMDNESIRLAQGPRAKGWQSFAEEIGLPPAFIANFNKIKSNEERRAGATPLGAPAVATPRQDRGPTATILGWWELKNKGQGLQAIWKLHQTFRRLRRLDVCRILDPVIEQQNQCFEEHPGVETAGCYTNHHELHDSVQETSCMQAGNREETTLTAAYMDLGAATVLSGDLYETDGTTSGIESCGSSPHIARSNRFRCSSSSYGSLGSYTSSNSYTNTKVVYHPRR